MTITIPATGTIRTIAAGFCVLLGTMTVQAAERQHDAHEHGVSEVKLAVEGNTVEIELESPGADIVGFEHTPATEADKVAVAKAAAILAKGGDVFAPAPAAQCSLIDADIDAPGMKTGHDDHGKKDHGHKDHDDHDKKGHAHGHAHDDEKKGKDHAHGDKHLEDGHAEFKAHYRFRCQNTDKLTHIDVKLFQHFPRAQEMRVQAITPAGQFVRELKPGSARLAL